MVRHSLILGMPSRPRSGRRGRTAELTVVWWCAARAAALPVRLALPWQLPLSPNYLLRCPWPNQDLLQP